MKTLRIHPLTCQLAILYFAMSPHVFAKTIGLDNFSDGNRVDGIPFSWFTRGNAQVSIGDDHRLVVQANTNNVPLAFIDGMELTNVSVRSKMQLLEGGAIGIVERFEPDCYGYYVLLGFGGENDTAILGISGGDELQRQTTNFDSASELVMQFDAIGDTISLWLWTPDEGMPDDPLIQLMNSSVDLPGTVATGGLSPQWPDPGPLDARFSFVHIADHSIRDGDATDDGRIDIDDLNAVRNNFGTTGPADGSVPGDTVPFDGLVNIDDLNAVRNSFGAGANIAVPEPGAGALVLVGVVLGGMLSARRRGR